MRIKLILLNLLLSAITLSCANQGVPSGGDKDTEAPKILKTTPENYTVNFSKKKIILNFDEFVTIKDANKNFTVSPPQKKKPRIRLKEKAIVIDVRDSLLPNMTYTFDFGQAIVDNNEGNPLGEYRYIVSTGQTIDSLAMAGYVTNSTMNEPTPEVSVALYPKTLKPDSLYHKLPRYITKTDSIGFFMFTNIANAPYQIVSFNDANNNNTLEEEESVGFLKENITPSESINNDPKDTLRFDKHTVFKNTNIHLQLCKAKPHIQYLKDYKRINRNLILFVFNAPLKDTLQPKLLNCKENPNFIIENLKNNDSLYYWIANENISKKDTLLAQLNFLKTNKDGRLAPYTDTLKLIAKKQKQRRKKKNSKKATEFLKIKTNLSSQFGHFTPIQLDFSTPVTEDLTKKINLVIPIDSVTEKKLDFTIKADSILSKRRFFIHSKLRPDTIYALRIDSASIRAIDKTTNDKLVAKFRTHKENNYGKIFLSILEADPKIVVELLGKQSKKKVIATIKNNTTTEYNFEHIPQGTYILRAYWDDNNNGKWDDGDFLGREYPEPVKVFPKEIELPLNWEKEVEWNLKREL